MESLNLGAAGAIGTVVCGVLIGLYQFFRIRASQKQAAAQLEPNGGASLRDAVDRIEKGVNTLTREVAFQGCEAKISGDISKRNTFRTDEHGSNIAVSRSYCKALGYLVEDLEDDRWQQIVHPDDRVAYLARLKAAIDIQSRFEAQVRLVKADSSTVRVLVTAEPVIINGEFHGLAGEWERLADPSTR